MGKRKNLYARIGRAGYGRADAGGYDVRVMTRSKLPPFWKNLELLSFESLTIVTRTNDGRRKKYLFSNAHELISFYEKCTGIAFVGNRRQDPDRVLQGG